MSWGQRGEDHAAYRLSWDVSMHRGSVFTLTSQASEWRLLFLHSCLDRHYLCTFSITEYVGKTRHAGETWHKA